MIWMLAQMILIGQFTYQVSYSVNSLGETKYPVDDSIDHRYIVLPTIATQLPISWEHEKLHACMHNHFHHYKTQEELRQHLEKQIYNEEELVADLTPCLLEADKIYLGAQK